MPSHDGPVPQPNPYRRHATTTRNPISPIAVAAVVLIAVVVIGIAAVSGGSSSPAQVQSFTPVVPAAAPAVAAPVEVVSQDAVEIGTDGCTLEVISVKRGDQGAATECVQKALVVSGNYTGPIDGVFSETVEAAAVQFQTTNGLYVDGIVGRRTAEELGIWPGDDSFVVHTPAPAPGTYDATGIELSPVATTGADAPPLPEGADQRTGKRVVYYRAGQRVWAIDDQERIVRSYLVTGSRFNNEKPGVHSVYSKSEVATGWNFEADLPYMVRYLKTERGNIGFHEIPIHKSDGTRYSTEAELGQRLSGGCQRQHPLDAIFMWNFADIGTTVIVI